MSSTSVVGAASAGLAGMALANRPTCTTTVAFCSSKFKALRAVESSLATLSAFLTNSVSVMFSINAGTRSAAAAMPFLYSSCFSGNVIRSAFSAASVWELSTIDTFLCFPIMGMSAIMRALHLCLELQFFKVATGTLLASLIVFKSVPPLCLNRTKHLSLISAGHASNCGSGLPGGGA